MQQESGVGGEDFLLSHLPLGGLLWAVCRRSWPLPARSPHSSLVPGQLPPLTYCILGSGGMEACTAQGTAPPLLASLHPAYTLVNSLE